MQIAMLSLPQELPLFLETTEWERLEVLSEETENKKDLWSAHEKHRKKLRLYTIILYTTV